MDLKLNNSVVIITGGARNLGKAMVLGFLCEGATVITTDRPDILDRVRFFEDVPERSRSRVRLFDVDVSTVRGCEDLCRQTIDEFGRIDVLVNSAAIHRLQTPDEITDLDFDVVLRNTLRSTLYMTRATFPIMKKNHKGRIVNISSAVVYGGTPNELVYSCAKAGVEAATRAFARLGAPDRITVNAIAPHFILTGMALETLERDPTIPSRIPLGRGGSIDEFVSLVLYLSSDVSEYITGQVVPLNGGRLMK